jgi:hypothetical protein
MSVDLSEILRPTVKVWIKELSVNVPLAHFLYALGTAI